MVISYSFPGKEPLNLGDELLRSLNGLANLALRDSTGCIIRDPVALPTHSVHRWTTSVDEGPNQIRRNSITATWPPVLVGRYPSENMAARPADSIAW